MHGTPSFWAMRGSGGFSEQFVMIPCQNYKLSVSIRDDHCCFVRIGFHPGGPSVWHHHAHVALHGVNVLLSDTPLPAAQRPDGRL